MYKWDVWKKTIFFFTKFKNFQAFIRMRRWKKCLIFNMDFQTSVFVKGFTSLYLQHSTGIEAACKESTFPLGCGIWTRNTTRTRVFLRPMSVSPFLSSMSEFLNFRIPAQSILESITVENLIRIRIRTRKQLMTAKWHRDKDIKSKVYIYIKNKVYIDCKINYKPFRKISTQNTECYIHKTIGYQYYRTT